MSDTGLRLLIIDDDREFCALMQKNLERAGYGVTLAHTSGEGLARMSAASFDAVVLDHDLRDTTGIEVLENLSHRGVPPVIFLTASSDIHLAVAALKAGAADYVIKDVHGQFYALLDRAIRVAINASRLEREKQQMEAEVRAARDRFKKMAEERELMMKEINHRVSNSLQLVLATLSIQSELASGEVAKKALNEAGSRVLAIAQVHRSLYSSFDVGWVALDEYLGTLIKDLRRMNEGEGGRGEAIDFEAEPMQSTPDIALATGIIMTELILNAFKHAYGGTGGEVRVKLSSSGNQVQLSVEDDGGEAGETKEAGKDTGFGKRLIARKLDKLDGSIAYQRSNSGLTVISRFPITKGVRVSPPSDQSDGNIPTPAL
jgi:two-component sensor histidine kinase/CheY-like chemotaxis protein